MYLKITLAILIIFPALFSCKKVKKIAEPEPVCEYTDQICDSAVYFLGNLTDRVIYFGIGTNMWEDTLYPNEVRAFKMGRVNIIYDKTTCARKRNSWATWSMHSSEGAWAFHIDHCRKVNNFEYNSDSVITLFDDTKY